MSVHVEKEVKKKKVRGKRFFKGLICCSGSALLLYGKILGSLRSRTIYIYILLWRYIYIYIMKIDRYIMKIYIHIYEERYYRRGSHGYGVWKGPRYALYKLRTSSIIQWESEDLRTNTHVGGQEKMPLPAQREQIHLLLFFCSILTQTWWQDEGDPLSQSFHSNASLSDHAELFIDNSKTIFKNVSWKHQRHTQELYSIRWPHIFAQSGRHIKLTIILVKVV